MISRLRMNLFGFGLLGCTCIWPAPLHGSDLNSLLSPIQGVRREGAGNREASRAWRELARRGPEDLPAILAGMDGASAVAANWFRTVVDAIAERALRSKAALPVAKLQAFILQKQHDPAARRLAYELVERVDPATATRLLPGLLLDPSRELRRDAVALVLSQAQLTQKHGEKQAAKTLYQKALSGARDRDQVDAIAKELKTLGVDVGLAGHFGFIQKWALVGPFDNTAGNGFQTEYPPERGVHLSDTYSGKKAVLLRWREHATKDPYCMVDLNTALGKHMGVVGYAFARVSSAVEQPVELRAGSLNAIKMFLNGKQVFFREEYHHGMEMDQHVGFGVLKKGRNEVLIKVCQNEQKDDWAQSWSFQLRLCDAVGGALPFTLVEDAAGLRSVKREVRP
jgi:hypothetical protein